MAYWRSYMEAMIAAQQALMEREASHIEEAARVITQSLRRDGVLHMFGSGHSHLPAEEAFYRSGGLAAVSPLLDPGLMFHEGTEKCIALEIWAEARGCNDGFLRVWSQQCSHRGSVGGS